MTSPFTVLLSIPPVLPVPLAQSCSHQVMLEVYLLVMSQLSLPETKGQECYSEWLKWNMRFLHSCFVSINLSDVRLPILIPQAFRSFLPTVNSTCLLGSLPELLTDRALIGFLKFAVPDWREPPKKWSASLSHWPETKAASQYHRKAEVKRDLWSSLCPIPVLKWGHLQPVAQMTFEYL